MRPTIFRYRAGETQMTRDENDRESPQESTDGGTSDDKSSQNDKNGDWIGELERELQEITKKWPDSRSLS